MSAAYELIPCPDWASTTTIAVPDGNAYDASGWASRIFATRSAPLWARALFALRQATVRVLGIPRGDSSTLAVSALRGDEAIIDTDDRHLHFVAGIRAEAHLLHVTTVVTFKGWRGRVYFLPVRFLHDQITRSMMHAAAS